MATDLKLAVRPGVYMRQDPAQPAPVVFEIPRSGAEYPRWFSSQAPLALAQKQVSSYVEQLYAGVVDAGATWLYACFPTVVIDPNRHALDIDPGQIDGQWPQPLAPSDKARAGNGLIPVLPGDAAPLAVADVQRRLGELYEPYHAELARLLREARARSGAAWHLSCHSMGAVAPASAKDAGQRRSDFDLGDRNGSTCEPGLVEVVAHCLQGFGYSVTVNRHFIGAEAVRRHGSPAAGIHSLQIEMNRSLYMDEKTREPAPGLPQVQAHMTQLAHAVVGYARSRAR
jgi:N-formylglutamate deformylase